MNLTDNSKLRSSGLVTYFWVLVVAWTIIVSGLLVLDVFQIRQAYREMAINEARAYFNKDQASRFWAASHGGVYVPITETTPSNPYLGHIPDRDIKTQSGKLLTLMNPAYMLRQMMEQYSELYGVRGQITSLKYFRPETAPDEWEKSALMAFDRGVQEVFEFLNIDGEPFLRLMRPMLTKKECLKCHGSQGYEVGDVRGGVSVSVPLASDLANLRREIAIHAISFVILWLIGLTGLVFASRGMRGRIKEREETMRALRVSEKKYSTLVESSLTGIFMIQDGKIVFANNRFADIHGYSREELIGIDSLKLVHPGDRPFVQEIREKRLKGKRAPSEYEARGSKKGGETIWVKRRIAFTKYDGKPAILGNVVDITQEKRIEKDLQKSEKELRYLSSQLLAAQEEERRRIASELHSGIGQSLSAIKYMSEAALREMCKQRSPKVAESLGSIVTTAQEAVEEVRRIYMGLRPTTLDDLGILATISWSCRELETIYSGIRIEKQIDIKEGSIPDFLKIVIYRVLQEALNNTAKHSRASLVHLSLTRTDGKIELAINDNGLGFDVDHGLSVEKSQRGLGLSSMKERIELSGGSFFIESQRGTGTTVRATWQC